MKNRSVDILGSKYNIFFLDESSDTKLENKNGYCDWTLKRIVVRRCVTDNDSLGNLDVYEKKVLRHEIVHAFLQESGLKENSLCYEYGWANCEEMVDWIAFQGLKIHAAWKSAGAI